MSCTKFASPRGQAGASGSSGFHNCPDPGSAGGVYIIPELSYEDASTRERITDKAIRINSAMQMLIALPLFSLKEMIVTSLEAQLLLLWPWKPSKGPMLTGTAYCKGILSPFQITIA